MTAAFWSSLVLVEAASAGGLDCSLLGLYG
jgi:hypothetical protein